MKYNLNDDEIMGNEKTFLKRRSNGMMLSDNDIKVLEESGLNYLDYKSLEELIFAILEELENIESPQLEELSIKLGEYNYYNYTNK